MDLQRLMSVSRTLIDDTVEPYLVPDEDVIGYLNTAVREACLRTRRLQDDASPQCQITLVPNQARYDLPSSFLVVRAAFVPCRREPLTLTDSFQLDRLAPGWAHEEQQPGAPKFAVFDVTQKTIVLQPPPAQAGTMKLRVWRLPYEEEEFEVEDGAAADPEAEPVLRVPSIESLKYWVAYEVYSDKDGELEDPQRAGANYGLFEQIFGPRPSIHDLEQWSTSRLYHPRMQKDY